MKKITLLFTILCASALNGMEAQRIDDLPTDLQEKITHNINEILKKALTENDNFEDTIKIIKVASASQGIRYDNLKDFTRLVQIIAKWFPQMYAKEIAKEFETPVAKNYIKLTDQLDDGIAFDKIKIVESAIQNGADVNTLFLGRAPISTTVPNKNLDIVKLLIKAGVDADSARKAQDIAAIRDEWQGQFLNSWMWDGEPVFRSHLIDQITAEMRK